MRRALACLLLVSLVVACRKHAATEAPKETIVPEPTKPKPKKVEPWSTIPSWDGTPRPVPPDYPSARGWFHVWRYLDGTLTMESGFTGPSPPGETMAKWVTFFDPRSNTWKKPPKNFAEHPVGEPIWLADGRALEVTAAECASPMQGGCRGLAVDLYEPKTDTWTKPHVLEPQDSREVVGLLPDGRVLFAGGYVRATSQPTADTKILDLKTMKLTSGPPMPHARAMHGHTVLGDGRLIVVGNNSGDDGADLYDPVARAWSTTVGDAPDPCLMPELIELRPGIVASICTTNPATIDVLDVAKGAWSALDPLARVSATLNGEVTMLRDGRLLLVGVKAETTHAYVYDDRTDALIDCGAFDSTNGSEPTEMSDGRIVFGGGDPYGVDFNAKTLPVLTVPP